MIEGSGVLERATVTGLVVPSFVKGHTAFFFFFFKKFGGTTLLLKVVFSNFKFGFAVLVKFLSKKLSSCISDRLLWSQ